MDDIEKGRKSGASHVSALSSDADFLRKQLTPNNKQMLPQLRFPQTHPTHHVTHAGSSPVSSGNLLKRKLALKRLLSDLEECLSEPLPGVSALPLEDVCLAPATLAISMIENE